MSIISIAALKKQFGVEYPAALMQNGIRIPLAIETPFSRYYHSGDPKKGGQLISRFWDGSASMTASELQRDWPSWTDEQRSDFRMSYQWLYQQSDFADMLRFLTRQACVSGDEVFFLLRGVLRAADIGNCSNTIQALAETNHPEANAVLRQHLRTIWKHPGLWKDDDWLNQTAAEAVTCIAILVGLGASPADFEEEVRTLSQHICPRNRDYCRKSFSTHYSWLN